MLKQFRVGSVIGGPALCDPITTTVTVTNGLFTVGLTFGAGAFTGEERYLDIRVNENHKRLRWIAVVRTTEVSY